MNPSKTRDQPQDAELTDHSSSHPRYPRNPRLKLLRCPTGDRELTADFADGADRDHEGISNGPVAIYDHPRWSAVSQGRCRHEKGRSTRSGRDENKQTNQLLPTAENETKRTQTEESEGGGFGDGSDGHNNVRRNQQGTRRDCDRRRTSASRSSGYLRPNGRRSSLCTSSG